MKATVIREGSHQGVVFSEVQEFNSAGLPSPVTYSVPGAFPVGTELEITVVDLGVKEEAEKAAEAETKTKAAKGK